MSNEEFKNITDSEFKEFVNKIRGDFPKHYQRIGEIKVKTVLTPEEALEIAKKHHKSNNMIGTVHENINQIFFNEAYTFKIDKTNRDNDDIRPAWRVQVDLPENPFLMEDCTLIVSDKDKKVMGQFDPNGHPVFKK